MEPTPFTDAQLTIMERMTQEFHREKTTTLALPDGPSRWGRRLVQRLLPMLERLEEVGAEAHAELQEAIARPDALEGLADAMEDLEALCLSLSIIEATGSSQDLLAMERGDLDVDPVFVAQVEALNARAASGEASA
jgi:hypothetical protein